MKRPERPTAWEHTGWARRGVSWTIRDTQLLPCESDAQCRPGAYCNTDAKRCMGKPVPPKPGSVTRSGYPSSGTAQGGGGPPLTAVVDTVVFPGAQVQQRVRVSP